MSNNCTINELAGYKVTYSAVLQAFGLKFGEVRTTPEQSAEPSLSSQPWAFIGTDRPFSLTFENNISFETTRLVTESPEELGVPAVVRKRLELGQFRLGIIVFYC